MRGPARGRGYLGQGILLASVIAWIAAGAQLDRWPAGDGPHILGTAMRLAQMLHDGEFHLFVQCLSSLLAPHPPGAYLPFVAGYTLVGTTPAWAHLVGGGIVLWACLDGIRRLAGGLAGCLWLGATGLVWVQAEAAGIDLVAGAAVIQSLSHLVASDRLRHRRSVWLWGAWMGAAFIAKYTAPFFLWGPCLVAGWWVLRRRRWRRLLEAVAAFAVVALPWWLSHAQQVRGYVQASGNANSGLLTNKEILTGPWYAAEKLSWYPAALIDAFGWPGALCLAAGLLIPWRWRAARPGAWSVPLLSVLGGWLVLNAQSQRQDRYILPAIPVAAAAMGASPIGWLAAPVGAIGLYGAALSSHMTSNPPATRPYTHHLDTAGAAWPWTQEAYLPTSMDPHRWELDEALRKVRALHGRDDGTVGFLLDEEGGAPGFGLVLSRATALGYRWHVATVVPVPQGKKWGGPTASIFVGPFTLGPWPSRAFDTLFAIVKTGDPKREGWLEESGMELVDSWALPQGRQGRIYVRPAAE